ncbi:bifunctional folylpolyglutamate synthase/dihydrofolate synthase [Enterococcus mediterraneensis]|uniref:bifunctional folylpolyglutamate synthase/dihydrofolate synthase n=1 Tax=Enterococcus mediterraneensis TaxID=2364791 RepID=UPI000F046D76|nr:folylpolyglutamate synthase/dihydrofolate synthase family protein [Enterococcus mediterraneensis]
MVKTGEEAIAWIHDRLMNGTRPGLERVNALLDRVGHPEKKLTVIHIAGTNGKGSTVSYLRSMLEEAGLTVGTFTSPFIVSFNERIQINRQFISDEDLVYYVNKYQPLVEEINQQAGLGDITEFELITAIGFDYFYEKKVDVAVIEVGIGGLWDSTNVVSPVLTGITTIGMDHMDMLGNTLVEIAAQKAGIIKEGIPVVTGNIPEEALTVIAEKAQKEHAPIYRLGEDYHVQYQHADEEWGEVFDYSSQHGKRNGLKTPLVGVHQPENAGLAIQLFELFCEMKHLPLKNKEIVNGLKNTTWPARMERLSSEPLILLDGAHNPHALRRLVDTIKSEFKEYHVSILFSALSTKSVEEMLDILLEIPKVRIYLTTFDHPKAIALNDNYVVPGDERVSIVSLWQFGLAEILEKMTNEDLLLITGSLYFVSDVRNLLLEMGGADE